MKEFNLDEYLKNPSQKVVTRDGREVRIICTDAKSDEPIIALVYNNIRDEENVYTYNREGYFYGNNYDSLDLFFASIKREGWTNVFDNFPKENHDYYCDKIYRTKEDAEKDVKKYDIDNYVTTTKIEWEEDEIWQ